MISLMSTPSSPNHVDRSGCSPRSTNTATSCATIAARCGGRAPGLRGFHRRPPGTTNAAQCTSPTTTVATACAHERTRTHRHPRNARRSRAAYARPALRICSRTSASARMMHISRQRRRPSFLGVVAPRFVPQHARGGGGVAGVVTGITTTTGGAATRLLVCLPRRSGPPLLLPGRSSAALAPGTGPAAAAAAAAAAVAAHFDDARRFVPSEAVQLLGQLLGGVALLLEPLVLLREHLLLPVGPLAQGAHPAEGVRQVPLGQLPSRLGRVVHGLPARDLLLVLGVPLVEPALVPLPLLREVLRPLLLFVQDLPDQLALSLRDRSVLVHLGRVIPLLPVVLALLDPTEDVGKSSPRLIQPRRVVLPANVERPFNVRHQRGALVLRHVRSPLGVVELLLHPLDDGLGRPDLGRLVHELLLETPLQGPDLPLQPLHLLPELVVVEQRLAHFPVQAVLDGLGPGRLQRPDGLVPFPDRGLQLVLLLGQPSELGPLDADQGFLLHEVFLELLLLLDTLVPRLRPSVRPRLLGDHPHLLFQGVVLVLELPQLLSEDVIRAGGDALGQLRLEVRVRGGGVGDELPEAPYPALQDRVPLRVEARVYEALDVELDPVRPLQEARRVGLPALQDVVDGVRDEGLEGAVGVGVGVAADAVDVVGRDGGRLADGVVVRVCAEQGVVVVVLLLRLLRRSSRGVRGPPPVAAPTAAADSASGHGIGDGPQVLVGLADVVPGFVAGRRERVDIDQLGLDAAYQRLLFAEAETRAPVVPVGVEVSFVRAALVVLVFVVAFAFVVVLVRFAWAGHRAPRHNASLSRIHLLLDPVAVFAAERLTGVTAETVDHSISSGDTVDQIEDGTFLAVRLLLRLVHLAFQSGDPLEDCDGVVAGVLVVVVVRLVLARAVMLLLGLVPGLACVLVAGIICLKLLLLLLLLLLLVDAVRGPVALLGLEVLELLSESPDLFVECGSHVEILCGVLESVSHSLESQDFGLEFVHVFLVLSFDSFQLGLAASATAVLRILMSGPEVVQSFLVLELDLVQCGIVTADIPRIRGLEPGLEFVHGAFMLDLGPFQFIAACAAVLLCSLEFGLQVALGLLMFESDPLQFGVFCAAILLRSLEFGLETFHSSLILELDLFQIGVDMIATLPFRSCKRGRERPNGLLVLPDGLLVLGLGPLQVGLEITSLAIRVLELGLEVVHDQLMPTLDLFQIGVDVAASLPSRGLELGLEVIHNLLLLELDPFQLGLVRANASGALPDPVVFRVNASRRFISGFGRFLLHGLLQFGDPLLEPRDRFLAFLVVVVVVVLLLLLLALVVLGFAVLGFVVLAPFQLCDLFPECLAVGTTVVERLLLLPEFLLLRGELLLQLPNGRARPFNLGLLLPELLFQRHVLLPDSLPRLCVDVEIPLELLLLLPEPVPLRLELPDPRPESGNYGLRALHLSVTFAQLVFGFVDAVEQVCQQLQVLVRVVLDRAGAGVLPIRPLVPQQGASLGPLGFGLRSADLFLGCVDLALEQLVHLLLERELLLDLLVGLLSESPAPVELGLLVSHLHRRGLLELLVVEFGRLFEVGDVLFHLLDLLPRRLGFLAQLSGAGGCLLQRTDLASKAFIHPLPQHLGFLAQVFGACDCLLQCMDLALKAVDLTLLLRRLGLQFLDSLTRLCMLGFAPSQFSHLLPQRLGFLAEFSGACGALFQFPDLVLKPVDLILQFSHLLPQRLGFLAQVSAAGGCLLKCMDLALKVVDLTLLLLRLSFQFLDSLMCFHALGFASGQLLNLLIFSAGGCLQFPDLVVKAVDVILLLLRLGFQYLDSLVCFHALGFASDQLPNLLVFSAGGCLQFLDLALKAVDVILMLLRLSFQYLDSLVCFHALGFASGQLLDLLLQRLGFLAQVFGAGGCLLLQFLDLASKLVNVVLLLLPLALQLLDSLVCFHALGFASGQLLAELGGNVSLARPEIFGGLTVGLCSHPDILEIAIFARQGHEPALFVVPDAEGIVELFLHCRAVNGDNKVLDHVSDVVHREFPLEHRVEVVLRLLQLCLEVRNVAPRVVETLLVLLLRQDLVVDPKSDGRPRRFGLRGPPPLLVLLVSETLNQYFVFVVLVLQILHKRILVLKLLRPLVVFPLEDLRRPLKIPFEDGLFGLHDFQLLAKAGYRGLHDFRVDRRGHLLVTPLGLFQSKAEPLHCDFFLVVLVDRRLKLRSSLAQTLVFGGKLPGQPRDEVFEERVGRRERRLRGVVVVVRQVLCESRRHSCSTERSVVELASTAEGFGCGRGALVASGFSESRARSPAATSSGPTTSGFVVDAVDVDSCLRPSLIRAGAGADHVATFGDGPFMVFMGTACDGVLIGAVSLMSIFLDDAPLAAMTAQETRFVFSLSAGGPGCSIEGGGAMLSASCRPSSG
ncbi:hypothetical protein CTA1_12492 [Colletotrichum tanaceti]|uniref:Uncharacterized protein n=1 Tax=Colletotrichum tanaceti TaxID=1306861 RepID=A0A4U6XAW0_9PEZI|nr:hypothetical protein CTA1_12492 [Colletotrichum tanaceti]